MRSEFILSSLATPPAEAGKASPAAAAAPDSAATTGLSPRGSRCHEKGCVFPAAHPSRRTCLHHDRQLREPKFFHSYQPTTLVMGQAIFSLPETDSEDTRQRDRRRLYAQREAFLEEAA